MNRFARVRLEEAGEDGRWTATLLAVEDAARAWSTAGARSAGLMRALVQRVQRASVEVDGAVVGEIGPGLLLFVGVGKNDVDEDGGLARARGLADKVANLRIFYDAEGKSNLSLLDTGGAALVISQFTLYADYRRGRRPSFSDAADPGPAEALVEEFRLALERLGVATASGRFAAHMIVSLVNDGPYTILVDTDELASPRRAAHRAAPASAAGRGATDMRLPDYHTHTARCGHARGDPGRVRGGGPGRRAARHRHRRPPAAPARARPRALHGGLRTGRLRGRGAGAQGTLPRLRPARHRGRLPAGHRRRGRARCSRATRSTTSSARSTTWATGASTTPGRWTATSSRDIDDVWMEYFELVGDAAESGLFTILGHLDLVKKFGYRPTRALDVELDRLVERIARAGVVVEINTAGLHKPVKEAYPSPDILRKLRAAGRPHHLRLRRAPARGGGTGLRPRGRPGPGGRIRGVRRPRARPGRRAGPRCARTSAGSAARARLTMKAAVIFNPSSGRGRGGRHRLGGRAGPDQAGLRV